MPAVFEEDGTVSRVPPVRSEPLLAELFADLQRIDETSILPDGDWVSVCVATWAAEWVKRLKDAGLISANAPREAGAVAPGLHADVGTRTKKGGV